jgi:hypothetical protein
MTTISEDTPAGGPDELQWKIDRLIEQAERDAAELERERRSHRETQKSLSEVLEKSLTLTNRLTVGTLRKAGFTVTIEEAEFCDTCGEEF